MSDATYRIKTRVDANGSPLLIVNFQVEYEVVLDTERFTEVHNTVGQYAEGMNNEKLTTEEFRLWEDELKRMVNLWNQLGEMNPYILGQLETKPSSIPRGLMHKILTTYEENTKSRVNIFTTGTAPNFSLNFNWGTLTYSFPIPPGAMRETQQAFAQMSAKTQQCIDEGKDWEKTKEALWETAGTVAGTGKVTYDIIKCALVLGGTAEAPALVLAIETFCTDIVTDLADMLDAIEAEKAAKEAAEREIHQKDIELKIRDSFRCADIPAGIEKSRDIDKGIRAGSTG